MTDNPFVLDVNAVLSKLPQQSLDTFKSGLEVLNARGVNSYDALFSLMRDLDTDSETLLKAYDVMYQLGSKVDKRRAVFPLINALKSDDSRVRQQAAWVLGALRSKRAVPFLMDVVKNRDEEQGVRIFAVLALQATKDERAIASLTDLMMDVEDDAVLRGVAIESLSDITNEHSLAEFIVLLSDASPDVRFWAAYACANIAQHYDISPALSAIDHIAAFDHVTTRSTFWHVDREALKALEMIYWHRLAADVEYQQVYLISPAPEYATFQGLRQVDDDDEPQPITLKLDPNWFADILCQQYPDIELNVRQPKPQTYLLDWKLTLDGGVLIGGVHRDGYGVVLTGKPESVQQFARWYRSIIPAEHKLFLYQWADDGVEL